MMIRMRSLTTCLLGVAWWVCGSSLLPLASYSQSSIELPKSQRPEPIVPQPTAPTYNPQNPPPGSRVANSPSINPEFQKYRLDTGDGLSITVPQFPEFSAVVSIDNEGKVVIPILGRIALAGLTISEVEAKIAYELGNRFLQEPPEVFVNLTAPRPAQISVLGEVSRAAGGSTNNADLRSITIKRTLVDGSIIEQNVDLYTPLVSNRGLPDMSLQGGDVVVVNKLKVGEDRDYDRALVARTTLPQQTIRIRVLVPASTGTALRNLQLPNGSTFMDAIASLPPDDNLIVKEEIALRS